jgi:hypothetical protein
MPDDSTSSELVSRIRELSVQLHWQHNKGGAQGQALKLSTELLKAVTLYQHRLVQETGYLPCT